MTKIKTLETILYRLPLPEPVEAAAAGVMGEFELVMVRIMDTDGVEGCGYTALMVHQGVAVAKIIENVCAEGVIGEDARNIEWLWSKLWKTHHYAGRGAPLSFAIAAVDAGNLYSVATGARRQWPAAEIVVCSDADDVGREKARAKWFKGETE